MEPNVPAKCVVHCWHDTGIVLTSYPPQTEEVCCECGERRYVRGFELLVEKKHGPFYPNVFRFNPTPSDMEDPRVGSETENG